MFKISYDKKITMVQGDTGVIRMRIHNYELSQGDEVRFAIVNKANPSILLCQHSDKKIVLEKQVTVFEKDGSARIIIYPYDTEYLQPGKYLYEIQVKTKDGRIDTVVPLASFTLMDGSIQGEFGQTTPSKPEPTPSEIELRFKRLENEIIPELGNRITNVEKDIDSVNSSLDNKVSLADTVKKNNIGYTTNVELEIEKCGDIYIPRNEYILNRELSISNDIKIVGDNGTLKGMYNIKIFEGCKQVYFEGINFNNVALTFDNSINNKVNIYINNCTFKNTSYYGLYLENIGELFIGNSTFENIGLASDIKETYQGIGIRVNNGDYIKIDNCIFKNCKGTGAIVVKKVKNLIINNNIFDKNDYRGIVLSNDKDYDFKTIGIISNNIIRDCGVYASHKTGVGCNGIYGNHGDFSNVTVDNNKIYNVCENGIEGTFGVVSNNLVDGTGVDIENHPTPSASGINCYGKVYKNNIIRNTHMSGLYVYDNVKVDGSGIDNLVIDGNIIENSKDGYGIYLNAQSYKNVKIVNNKTDEPLYVNNTPPFLNCYAKENYCAKDNFYKKLYGVSLNLVDKGVIIDDKMEFTENTLTNYTINHVTIDKTEEYLADEKITIYYPKVTNSTSNTYGRLEKKIATPKNSILKITITYKGNIIDFSAIRQSGGVNGMTNYKKLPNSDEFITETFILPTENSENILLYIKVNNGASGESAFIKNITYKIIS